MFGIAMQFQLKSSYLLNPPHEVSGDLLFLHRFLLLCPRPRSGGDILFLHRFLLLLFSSVIVVVVVVFNTLVVRRFSQKI